MNRVKSRITCFSFIIITQLFILPGFSVSERDLDWGIEDTFTWEFKSYYRQSQVIDSIYNNGPYKGDSYNFDLKVIAITELNERVFFEKTSYLTETPKIERINSTYSLGHLLSGYLITDLLQFSYDFNDTTNEIFLSDVNVRYPFDPFPIVLLCDAQWSQVNSIFQLCFNDSNILDTINDVGVTFGDFLANCNYYSIMDGLNNTQALALLSPSTHQWDVSFDYASALQLNESYLGYSTRWANTHFELRYTSEGILERFYLSHFIDHYKDDNNSFSEYVRTSYSLIDSHNQNTLSAKIIPAVFIGVLAIIIIFQVAKIQKYRSLRC